MFAGSASPGTFIAPDASAAPRRPTGRVIFRCDGNERIGAGHVARCVPLAAAFAQLGWEASFAGRYEGLAGWLLDRAGVDVRFLDPHAPCGIAIDKCDLAIVDSYEIEPAAICELARALPLVTLAEANRCRAAGLLLDYHLDRVESRGARLLAGPSFAPLDPAFAGAGRAGKEIRAVLTTAGGSLTGRELLPELIRMVTATFPEADMVLAVGAKSETLDANASRVAAISPPSVLVDRVRDVDLAVTTAGLTAYEMACAGIPQVAIAVAENQSRVVRGLRECGLASCLDLTGGDSLGDLPNALEKLRDAGVRRRLAERGMKTFDGNGAHRAALALTCLFEAGWQDAGWQGSDLPAGGNRVS